ncbi:hypothetical protein ACHAPU_009325 [Fusarium lateritium]
MDIISYEIYSGGDIELVLREPNSLEVIPKVNSTHSQDTEPDEQYANSMLGERYAIFNSFDGQTPVRPIPDQIRMRVSSRHLIRASPMFRRMLEGQWKEGTSSSSQNGVREIFTTGWDAKALAIVLDIMHGRHRENPLDFNLGLLARIATIVDYYQCQEIVQRFAGIWTDEIKACDASIVECLLAIYVTWVFGSNKRALSYLSATVLRHSKGLSDIDLRDLPLAEILGTIDDKRQEFISRIKTCLTDFDIRRSDKPAEIWKESCCLARYVLGQEEKKAKQLGSLLVAPYHGHSLISIADEVLEPDIYLGKHWNTCYECGYMKSSLLAMKDRIGKVADEIDREAEQFSRHMTES